MNYSSGLPSQSDFPSKKLQGLEVNTRVENTGRFLRADRHKELVLDDIGGKVGTPELVNLVDDVQVL